jgi:hypothetical protein
MNAHYPIRLNKYILGYHFHTVKTVRNEKQSVMRSNQSKKVGTSDIFEVDFFFV